MREVIFIQTKFPSNERELEALLGRWNGYGRVLNTKFGGDSIKVVSPIRKFDSVNNYERLLFISGASNGFKKMLEAKNFVKSTSDSVILVCGDNQLSLLLALLLKARLPNKIEIQTQFHGDIYSREKNSGFKGLIRTLTSRCALRVSDSIRIVSEFQELEIRKLIPYSRARFIVSPIPIDYSKIPDPGESIKYYDVALIGRLQVQRGIHEAVSIIKLLVKLLPSVKIAIVGDGPEAKSVEEQLQVEVSSGRVVLTGPLFGSEIRRIFAQSKVLLSAAPSEGYGLTLREALLSGMTIVARDSLGARESSTSLPSRYHFYSTEEEAVAEIVEVLNARNRIFENSGLISHQREMDDRGILKLIETWVGPNS